jgi:hypothetical protein
MRDDDVAHPGPLLVCQSNCNTSSVDRDTVVDQEAGQALIERCLAFAVKRTG